METWLQVATASVKGASCSQLTAHSLPRWWLRLRVQFDVQRLAPRSLQRSEEGGGGSRVNYGSSGNFSSSAATTHK